MAEPVSAIIHLVHFAHGASRFIQNYARGVKHYNTRVHELAECIETHGDALYAVHSVYGQIKDRPEAPIRSVAEKLARCVKKSRELLEKLTQVKGEWGCGDLPGLTRLLRHYEYDQNGGRDQVEKFLSKIEKLQGSIQTLLITANILINTANSPTIDDVSVFSRTSTLHSLAETPTFITDHREFLSQALIEAIRTRKPKEVKLRLKDGDSVLARDNYDNNALHIAVKAGGRRVLAELLKCKEIKRNPAAINVPNGEGETPLHLAARWGRTELVEELLEAGADVDALDNYERPPLEGALRGNNYDDIVELLLQHNADESLLKHEGRIDRTIARRLSQVKQIINSRR